MNKCEFCNKEINNKGSLVAHTNCCKQNPNKIKRKRSKLAGQKKGCIPWNKNKKFNQESINRIAEMIETEKYKTQSDNSIRRLVRNYLINKCGHKCMICGLSEWMGQILPLVCDHIDGDSKNNELNNFRIICNNCDSILPTFKGKNRGNGRLNRYKNFDERLNNER
jgi:hypothetical protein